MRIFLSTDFEGVAGIVDWQQVTPGPEYELGRRLLLGEVNAAIEGALAAGATQIVVNDAHGPMQNLPPDQLRGGAEYVSGRHKPLYMMEGLDPSFDAIFLLGYHGASGGPSSVLSHTYNPAAVLSVTIAGKLAGESAINALVAAHMGVPVALVTGDQHTATQAAPFCPGAELVVVKRSITRFSAQSLPPDLARERIRDAAQASLARLAELTPPSFPSPCSLLVRMRNADLAELATSIHDVSRRSDTEVEVSGADPLALYRDFVAVVQITRGLAQER